MTPIRRREVLAAVGVAGTLSLVTGNRASDRDQGWNDATISVRVYPGPVPAWIWARYGLDGYTSGWLPPYRAARAAVESALEPVDATSVAVEAGRPIETDDLSMDDVSPSRSAVLDAFRQVLHERGVISGTTCHLLLWWGPLDWAVGYGGTRPENGHVTAVTEEGTQSVCNVGATEVWDNRSITRNMAIHETVHAFLSDPVIVDVAGTTCDHDLGTIEWRDDRTVEISPMATAYGLPDRIGIGTQWPGTGCVDRERFDRLLAGTTPERVSYTTALSDTTRQAISAYVRRAL